LRHLRIQVLQVPVSHTDQEPEVAIAIQRKGGSRVIHRHHHQASEIQIILLQHQQTVTTGRKRTGRKGLWGEATRPIILHLPHPKTIPSRV
jgi:hypothetical protein